jgi:dTDP-4-amino-4,6-dideoxygalactose transaminase
MFPMVSRRVISLYRGELADIARLLFKKQFVKGGHSGVFEKDFSRYTGAKYSVTVGSGRLALFAIMQALNLPKGTEVILSAYEDMSVPEAIRQAGLSPVFVDIDRKTQNMDLAKLKEKVTNKTSAIVAAHIFGNPVDVAGIKAIIGKRKIVIVEDCAHALGARSSGKHVGNTGDVAFFSFHATKPFNCFGGSMIITNDAGIYKAVKSYLDGLPCPGYFDILQRMFSAYFLSFVTSSFFFSWVVVPCLIFLNWINAEALIIYHKLFKRAGTRIEFVRFVNVQAWVGIKNLKDLDAGLSARRRNAGRLDELLKSEIGRPLMDKGCNHYFFILFSKEREAFRKRLLKEGLDSGKSLMRNCPGLLKVSERFPNTDIAENESVQIPIYEKLSLERIEAIARVINKHYIC